MLYDIRKRKSSRCAVCQHSLYALHSDRCPECGTPFNPFEVRGVFRPPPGAIPGWIVATVFLILVITGVLLLMMLGD